MYLVKAFCEWIYIQIQENLYSSVNNNNNKSIIRQEKKILVLKLHTLVKET